MTTDTNALPDENERAIFVTTEDTIAPQLSPREKSILRCLVEGDSNKSIARKIDIAEATVKVHVKAILRKIRVQNRTQAAIWAMNHGALARAELSNAPPSGLDIDRRMPKAIDVISNVKQIEAPGSRELINGQANHVGVPRIASLFPKASVEGRNGRHGSPTEPCRRLRLAMAARIHWGGTPIWWPVTLRLRRRPFNPAFSALEVAIKSLVFSAIGENRVVLKAKTPESSCLKEEIESILKRDPA